MTTIGYARVSTTDQDLEIQIKALKAAGCEVIRSEKRSGTTTEGRAELQTVLDFLRSGDVLMVTRIDRLARSIGEHPSIERSKDRPEPSRDRPGKEFEATQSGRSVDRRKIIEELCCELLKGLETAIHRRQLGSVTPGGLFICAARGRSPFSDSSAS
jgi:hypothetical protein